MAQTVPAGTSPATPPMGVTSPVPLAIRSEGAPFPRVAFRHLRGHEFGVPPIRSVLENKGNLWELSGYCQGYPPLRQ